MKYISSLRLLNISSLTLIYFKEQTYLWWSNRTFTEIFLTMWLPAQITSFKKWPNKILNDERNIVRKVIRYWTMRNIVRKVARKYFCRDASNPSEPAGLNTSDSELEKRVRPSKGRESENFWNTESTIMVASKVQFKRYQAVPNNMWQWTWESERHITSRGGRVYAGMPHTTHMRVCTARTTVCGKRTRALLDATGCQRSVVEG